jgi:crotonobetainyl-CoA:carnitine CoA-transferase CaiB-like acyl-CoA transferase
MPHDPRILKHEDRIAALNGSVPDWIKRLERPAAPVLMPRFGPLEGIRAVGTGVLVAQPYVGTKLAEFGAEVIHVERPGGDTFRFIAPLLTRGPRQHGCDEAEVGKNKLSMGIDLRHRRGAELLMALWKISDIWRSAPRPERWNAPG